MRKGVVLVLGVLLLAGVATAERSAFTGREAEAVSAPRLEVAEDAAVTAAGDDPVAAAMAGMDLKTKVCQLMMVTLAGEHQPRVDDLAYLRSYTPGAAIIGHASQPGAAAGYVARVRSIEGASGVPIWVGANLAALSARAGMAPSGFIQLPAPLAVSATGDPDCVDRLGRLMAEHMKSMGFDLHLGPALDLAPTLSDAPGTLATLGSDPAWVSLAGVRLCAQFEALGVMPAPMGFPGGGADRVGREPPVLLTPRMHLSEMDLAPYAAAVKAGARMIHVGPTHVPGIDPAGGPACASAVVLRDLLRGELGFEGLVVAGPMDSTEVAAHVDPEEAALRALGLGADMIYWQGAGPAQMQAVERIVLAVESGVVPVETIDTAVRRVLAEKYAGRLDTRAKVRERDAERLEDEKDLLREALEVERQSITLVKNAGDILPLSKESSMPVGVTGVVGVEALQVVLEDYMKPVSQQAITTARHLGDIQGFEIERLTTHTRGIRTVVCVLTDQIRPQGMARLVAALQDTGARVVVVFLGYPRDLAELMGADAIVAAYSDGARCDATMAAVGEMLAGEGALAFTRREAPLRPGVGEALSYDIAEIVRCPAGVLPVRIADVLPAGHGLRYDPTAGIKAVAWDFGDGSRGKGPRVSHAYAKAGTYTLRVSLTDVRKQTREHTYDVVVAP